MALGAVLRVAWFLWTRNGPPQAWFRQGDQFGYFYYGREIALGHGYVSYLSGEATAYYPVGFPAVLAVLYVIALRTPITDDLMLVTGVFQIAVAVATIALYGNPRFHVPLAPFGALGAAATVTTLAGVAGRSRTERPAPTRPATAE